MDIITQGLLGGVLARSSARDEEKKPAVIAGVFAGLLADADILIRSADDPLLNIEYHRHFTHSLLFIPLGAAIACLILWPFLRNSLSIKRLFIFCLLGYSLSGVLDALTSYGTMLFWPLSESRVALNLVSVVDPVVTLILISGLILALRYQGRRIAGVTLLLCVLYLGFAWTQQQRALGQAVELAAARGHHPQRHIVKPTLGNVFLWRSVYLQENRFYIDAVHVSLPGRRRIYTGDSVIRYEPDRMPIKLSDQDTLYSDIRRFIHFSDGYVALYSQRNMLGDVRYSMSPNGIEPLWGIVFDPDRPDEHVDYQFFRDTTPAVRQRFVDMLLGRCLTRDC